MSVQLQRAACGNCPFWMRGFRIFGPDGRWVHHSASGQPQNFGDCRRRAALPEVGEDGMAWGRPHESDWCAEHPRFTDQTAQQAQAELARCEEGP